jgi:two-component system, NarL family, response regulator LiaR
MEETMQKIKVMIADKYPAFREWLNRIISETEDMEVIAQAVNGDDAVETAEKAKPDVVVMDIALSRQSGIEATRKIKLISQNTGVLILSAYTYQSHILTAFRAGASGYLTKDTPETDIVSAIRIVHSGEGIIDRGIAKGLIKHIKSGKDDHKGTLDLYPRELEVLRLVAKGFRNKEIAFKLDISERTVQAHMSNIFGKLQVDSRTEAVLYSLRSGLLNIADLT